MTDTMPEKIDLSSVRPSDEKLAALRDLVPEAFTEGKIDFDALRRSLGDAVETAPREERFGLRWPGKSRLQQVINQPSVGTLVPQPEESVDWDTTKNIIIEGDNLEVLKLLQKSYAGKVKMIYIDPPYNTGNDFVYPDSHIEGLQSYLEFTGQKNAQGQTLQANTETGGRYHSNWLNMMYPRLYLAKNLLREDGVIFISIDDSEQDNLRKLCSEIFGEECVEQYIWDVREPGTMPKTAKNTVRKEHEYLVAAYRSKEQMRLDKYAELKYADKEGWSNPDNDPRGDWMSGNISRGTGAGSGGSNSFVITNPAGIAFDRNWSVSPEEYEALLKDNRIFFANNGQGVPRLKIFKNEPVESTQSSIFEGLQSSQSGAKSVSSLLEGSYFDHPKPVPLLKRLVQIGAAPRDSIIMDFFAGSGTTAHAVMQHNAEDGSKRRYILVQLPEPLEEPKSLDDGTTLRTIADICRERVRRAGKKIAAESGGKNLDTGFRAYRLAPSNFRPWDGRVGQDNRDGIMTSARQASFMPQTIQQQLELAAEHLRPEANDDGLLAELLLRLGFELTTPVIKESMAGKTVYDVDDNLVLICLDRNITLDVIDSMAKRMPAEIICLDAGFPNDQAKVNAGQIIASQARDEETSIAFKVV